MEGGVRELIHRLAEGRSLMLDGYEALLAGRDEEADALLADLAVKARREIYGDAVYVRGLIEIGNVCRNDCLYCGIRRSNAACARYRLGPEEILSCAGEGWALGFRTFVLQGGEDPSFTDELLCSVVGEIKARCPGCAVTLSLGERSRESYARLREAGADRYLLRHETADRDHYARLHPPEMSFDERMRCLRDLRELGYQVGCGLMVGSPFQTVSCLAKDLELIETFRPDMCGVGPFIPHRGTPFRGEPPGPIELTCCLLSIIRLIHPPVLLPATTALGTIHAAGREMGIRAGANVVMPNLTPPGAREKYDLYDGKTTAGADLARGLDELARRIRSVGCEPVMGRGDVARLDRPDLCYHKAALEGPTI